MADYYRVFLYHETFDSMRLKTKILILVKRFKILLMVMTISKIYGSFDPQSEIGMFPSYDLGDRSHHDMRMAIVQDWIDFVVPGCEEEDNNNLFKKDKKSSQQDIVPSSILSRVSSALFPSSHIQQVEKKSFMKNRPKFLLRSTGTTIAGIVLEESGIVLLGADTRATDGTIVADKLCSKIHFLSKGMYACGAGTSADLDATARLVKYSMKLQQVQDFSIGNHCDNDIKTMMTRNAAIHQMMNFLQDLLYENKGNLSVNMIVGGLGYLVALHPHGSLEVVPYAALGSGGLAAMAILEREYHPNLSLKEARTLLSQAIQAGINNDLGSGSQVDLCILYPTGKVEYLRAAIPEAQMALQGTDTSLQYETSGGANGFGNTAFREQSRHIILRQLKSETNKQENWNSILGL